MESATKSLPKNEILAILRAADEIIAQGGRTLLAKILKGSREKKVLALELDECPVYGYFKSEKMETVKEKIEWMIDYEFLDIQYSGKLPMIVFTERGWYIERDRRVDEFLAQWDKWIDENRPIPDMTYLKDRNRNMILLLLKKIQESGETKYIPYLEAWEQVDYKKVRAEIRKTISMLKSGEQVDRSDALERQQEWNEALKGSAPQDILLKCWECGDRFTFTIGEQKFFKDMGFQWPKRCKKCRLEREFGELF